MAHGLRLRDRQHDSRGNPGPVVQSDVSKLAGHPANGSGCAVRCRRGSRDQCRLAHCVPGFHPLACPGSARRCDQRHSDLRSADRALLRKSQIVYRQSCLSAAHPFMPIRGPRSSAEPPRCFGGTGCNVRNRNHLRAPIDDHACHRVLFAVASSVQSHRGQQNREFVKNRGEKE